MEIVIAKYTLIFFMPAEAIVVLKAVLAILKISKRVRGVAVKRVPLRLRILL